MLMSKNVNNDVSKDSPIAIEQEYFAKRSDFSSTVLSWRFHNLLVIFCRCKTACRSQNV